MDSRERTFLSLNHQEPDRVPIDCWMSSGMKKKIEKGLKISYEQFLDVNDVDFRYIAGPRYIGPELYNTHDNVEIDIWGVSRVQVSIKAEHYEESYKEVLRSPLQDLTSPEEILEYNHWPSPDWFDYSDIEEQCRRIKEQGRVVVFMGDRLNRFAQLKPAMYLRGIEQILIDMIENPEIARAIFAQIASFYLEYGERILEAGKGNIDILCTGDDFGGQTGPLLSPSLWIDFLKKGFKGYVRLGKAFNAYIMHHTCGSVYPLIPEMIDCDLDILQSLQPEVANMNPQVLKQEFGNRLSFHGGISIQQVLPHGSVADVKDHVRLVVNTMAPGGGYIVGTSHNIQADTPLVNVQALFEAYHDFGCYGR
jgi:uroporphyrinogen decarboxylase